MRFKLTLTPNLSVWGNALPQNCLYEISDCLRFAFAQQKNVFINWLKQNDLYLDEKSFCFFCYSRFHIPSSEKQRDRLLIGEGDCEFQLSFLPENGTEEMIHTIFENQKVVIGDFLTKVEFQITKIEQIEFPEFRTLKFRTISPIYLPILRKDDSLMSISPETENYDNLLFQNLKKKYRQYYGKPFIGDESFVFRVLEESRSCSVIVNAGMKTESKLRAFDTTFYCEADHQLLKLAYESGVGEKNSIGFGMVEEIDR